MSGIHSEGASFRKATGSDPRLSPSGKTMACSRCRSERTRETKTIWPWFVFDTVTASAKDRSGRTAAVDDLAREHRLLDDGDAVLIGNEVFGMSDGKKRFGVFVDTEYYPAGEFTAIYQFANVLAVSPDQKSFFTVDTTWPQAMGYRHRQKPV